MLRNSTVNSPPPEIPRELLTTTSLSTLDPVTPDYNADQIMKSTSELDPVPTRLQVSTSLLYHYPSFTY